MDLNVCGSGQLGVEMKKYLSFFRLRFIMGLQYRTAAAAGGCVILQRFSVQGSVSYAAVAETGLIVSGMMLLAVRKGIFGKEKRKRLMNW